MQKTSPIPIGHRRCFLVYVQLLRLLQEQLLEQKHPHEVEPSEDEASAEGYYQADYKTDESALLGPRGPSYNYLGYPVHKGDNE